MQAESPVYIPILPRVVRVMCPFINKQIKKLFPIWTKTDSVWLLMHPYTGITINAERYLYYIQYMNISSFILLSISLLIKFFFPQCYSYNSINLIYFHVIYEGSDDDVDFVIVSFDVKKKMKT